MDAHVPVLKSKQSLPNPDKKLTAGIISFKSFDYTKYTITHPRKTELYVRR